MKVEITLRRNSDGLERRFVDNSWNFEGATPEGVVFQWTEGNYGCDCNRHRDFARAEGREPTEEEGPFFNNVEHDCGDKAYSLVDITVDDVKQEIA